MDEKIVKYQKPPLVEAVFELFYFSKNWNAATIGLFYNEIKDEFGSIQKSNVGFGLQVGVGGVSIGGGNELTQFRNAAGDTVVQLSNSLLTVNKLPVYNSWESYFEIISNILVSFKKIIGDYEIKRLGLKFLNKINIGDHISYENFKNVFEIYPILPESCQDELGTISLNFEYPTNNSKDIIALSLNTLNPETGMASPVLFQLYAIRINDLEIEINAWIIDFHKKLRDIFEKSIKPEIKQTFK